MTGRNPMLTVDVAHPSVPQHAVEEFLEDAMALLRNRPGSAILKIIHGYGSSGRGGKTKEVVLNWTFRNKARFRAIITGEEYTLFNADVQLMKEETGFVDETDLMSANPGITVCWIR